METPCGEVAVIQLCESVSPHFVCCLVMARGCRCYSNHNLIGSRVQG